MLYTDRLPQRRSATGTGSRLPTGPLTSKHVTSVNTRETTPAMTTNNNNNNNSPPSESPASHSTDVSRGSSDVVDQSGRVRPSPAGKRSRKCMPSGGRGARALAGPGDTVDAAGVARRAAPVAGKLSVSATSSPVSLTAAGGGTMSENNSSRKQTTMSTISTSLTNVAAKTDPGGGGCPEMTRRKATMSSRLAVPRAPGRLPKAPRPASDGGGTTTGSASYRGLGSKLPSAVSGSVGAISDAVVQSSARKQHQQHSSKSDHPRPPVVSTSSSSSSSPGRLTELRVQFGLTHDTQHDLPSLATSGVPSDTHGTADDIESLPVGHGKITDKLSDPQSLPENQGEFQSVDSHGYDLNASGWQKESDEEVLSDKQAQHQNIEDSQCHGQNIPDGQLSQGLSQTVPYGQKNDQCLTDEQKDCKENHQNFSEKDSDRETVGVDEECVPVWTCDRLSINDEQFMMREDKQGTCDTAATCSDMERMTSAFDEDDVIVSRDTDEVNDVIHIPSTSSVVMTTTDATGTHSTSVSGKYVMMIKVR